MKAFIPLSSPYVLECSSFAYCILSSLLICSSLAANKTIEPQAEAPLVYLSPVRLLYDPSLSFDVLHYFILYSFSNLNLTRDHGCNGQVRSDRSRSVDSMDRWRVSCSPDRGTFLVNSTPIKLDMPRLMVWTMINLLILFDTEFKVSDFFFSRYCFCQDVYGRCWDDLIS